MSVLNIIRAKLDSLTQAEQTIGRFILDNPDRMVALSSAELASATGRSQSSVVKFAQKIGYAGYQQLKLAVTRAKAQEWQVPSGMIHGSIDASDDYMTIQQKLVASKLHSMQETMQVNGEDSVARAVKMLSAARRIHMAGVGASSLVARDFSYKLQKLGRMVLIDSDSHVQIANAATLGEGDALFAISYSGASLETLRVAELAAKRGASVLSLTGLQPNPLTGIAHLHLYTIADEERVRSSAITSRDAQLILTDLLFLMLVQHQADANDYIHASEAAVSVLKA